MSAARRYLAAVWLLTAAVTGAAAAQSPAELLAQAMRSYQDLDLDLAAGFLRRALLVRGEGQLPRADRARALIYLSAAELFRDRRDSALSAARQLVLLEPRYRPDELAFPPAVLQLFEDVRRATPAAQVTMAADTSVRLGAERIAARLYASGLHEIDVRVAREDGRPLRQLYRGPIGDSLDVLWDGLDSAGTPIPNGRYILTVSSRVAGGAELRRLQAPLEVAIVTHDTLPHPPPLSSSAFRPERARLTPALKALAPGLAAGAAVVLLPRVAARGEDASGARYAVGVAVTLGGLVGFARQHPGRLFPENVEYNRRLREEWVAARDSVVRENGTRRADVRLAVKFGEPVTLNLETP